MNHVQQIGLLGIVLMIGQFGYGSNTTQLNITKMDRPHKALCQTLHNEVTANSPTQTEQGYFNSQGAWIGAATLGGLGLAAGAAYAYPEKALQLYNSGKDIVSSWFAPSPDASIKLPNSTAIATATDKKTNKN